MVSALSCCTLSGCSGQEESADTPSDQYSKTDTDIPTEPTTLPDIADEGEYENFRYSKEGDEITITGCVDRSVTVINVPDDIYGYPVTKIADRAFDYCQNADNITLPDTIKSVGINAFEDTKLYEDIVYNWDNPQDFILNDVLIHFVSPEGTDYVIPDGVRVLADGVLNDRNMTSVTIPEGVMYIGNSAVSWCAYLETVSLPSNIVSIGDCAFQDCWNLKSINIPNGTKSIGSYAFSGCKELSEISIPESVEEFGNNPFVGMPWLENRRAENPMVIINNVLIDGKDCKGDLTIPDSVVRIGGDAFQNSEITSVVIPESVESVGEYSFAFTKNLSSVTVSESCKVIEEGAFAGCEGLQEITFLSPDCEIPMSSLTIYNKGDSDGYYITFWYDGVIKGYANSTAQAYAEKYDYTFIEIN